MSFTASVQFLPVNKFNDYLITLSPHISYLYGTIHHLEVGIGFSLFSNDSFKDALIVLPINIGYRYQKNNGGIFWRLSLMSAYFLNEDGFLGIKFWPIWGGVSLGYTFKNKKS